jgi:ABC-type proline/glycine betaine transport system ATPase subunit
VATEEVLVTGAADYQDNPDDDFVEQIVTGQRTTAEQRLLELQAAVREHHQDWVRHNSTHQDEMWPRDLKLWRVAGLES